MIDFHSHIIWKLDDGSDSAETSIAMVKNSIDDGIEGICATCHYVPGEFTLGKKAYIKKLAYLQGLEELSDTNIYSGLEVYMDPTIPSLLEKGEIWSINSSRYLLIELPRRDFPLYTQDVLYELRVMGIVPIIAHPERNYELRHDKDLMNCLLEEQCLFQVNAGSLIGEFGKGAKSFAHDLMKENLIHALGSDAHDNNERPTDLSYAYDIVKKGNPRLYTTLLDNEYKILSNEPISQELSITKKKLFSFFKRK